MAEFDKFIARRFELKGDAIFAPGWRTRLETAGLSDFDAFYSNSAAEKIKHVRDERATFRLSITAGEKPLELFVKCTVYSPLRTALRNFFKIKRENPSALYELENLLAFKDAGLPVAEPAAAGFRRRGGKAETFLATFALPAKTRLSDFAASELKSKSSPTARMKKAAIIRDLAAIARKMHGSGLCHRDLYLVHFLLDESALKLYLLDLNRALRFRALPRRWAVKDLAALDFSAPAGVFSNSDRVRFILEYLGADRLDENTQALLTAVRSKSRSMERHAKKARARDARYVDKKGGMLP